MTTAPDALATDPAAESSSRAAPRWRRRLAWIVLVLGCIVLLIANVAVFARTLVFDTDTFADVVAPEQPDEDVIAGVADTLSDKIVTAAAVQDRVQELTPRDNALVAATVADTAENIIDETVRAVMQNDRFRGLWHDAVVGAHDQFVALVEGDTREPVQLDLGPAVEQVDQRLEERGIDLIDDATVEEVGEIVALRRSQIDDVRQTVDLARHLAIALPIAAIVLIAAAVALAPDRRRMLARAGVGIVVAMVVTAVALRIARRAITDRVEIDERRQAVESLWGRLFETLFQQTAALAALGLVLALGAWLAGPSPLAVRWRARIQSLGARGTASPEATEPSAVARLLGTHRAGVRLGILAVAAGALLLLPGPSAAVIVVVALLALAAIVGTEIVAAPPPAQAP